MFLLTLLLVDAGSCLSQAGSTGRRNLSFDGIYTPTGTPNQKRKTPEKHVEPTNLEGEQTKNDIPPIVVEKESYAKEVSGSCLFGKTVVIVFFSRAFLIVSLLDLYRNCK